MGWISIEAVFLWFHIVILFCKCNWSFVHKSNEIYLNWYDIYIQIIVQTYVNNKNEVGVFITGIMNVIHENIVVSCVQSIFLLYHVFGLLNCSAHTPFLYTSSRPISIFRRLSKLLLPFDIYFNVIHI